MIKLSTILKEIIDIYSPEELNSKDIEYKIDKDFSAFWRKIWRCNFTCMEENIIYKIELFKEIEKLYNIEIKDEEVEEINSIEDLINLIKYKQLN